ncbi:MAG: creD [Flaviaesturariibacter sp.]|nr:creD [Flaviaesturariibacter sp.]
METATQNLWSKSKVLIKGFVIGFLVLLLLIPTFYVQNLIEEREQRQKEAIAEVSSKWAGRQTVTGPMIGIPFWQVESETAGKIVRSKHYAYFLPDQLSISSQLMPQEKHRGIYKVMLYTSTINLSGSFQSVDPQKLGISPADIIWSDVFVKLSIADVKGLNEEVNLKWGDSLLNLSPQTFEDRSGSSGLTAPLPVSNLEGLRNISFSTAIHLNGSGQLQFTPTGKSTTVSLNSAWPHPSFTGDILPQTTQIKDSGFTATWKSLAHKRSFPQQWKDDAYSILNSGYGQDAVTRNNLTASAFGADLFVPVNGYQKTMRSIKYAVLCILLTFAGFFLIETTNKRNVHPFHYGLIGLALVLFYTLLLSFSEYIGFNLSYAIASVCTIGLITWFVRGLLSSGRLSALLSAILVLMYTYVFTILQLQDYSLLFGSIGLFLTLAVIMYFSKKLQW